MTKRLRALVGGVMLVTQGLIGTGCDQAPDIHVHVRSNTHGPQEYALWRVYRGRRLLPRQQAQATYDYGRVRLGSRRVPLAQYEVPTVFRVTPAGALPEHTYIALRIDRYVPSYTPDFSWQRVYVFTKFEPNKHRRLDVSFGEWPCPGLHPSTGGFPSGRAPEPGDSCANVNVPRGCHVVTMAERERANAGPVPSREDFDESDGDDYLHGVTHDLEDSEHDLRCDILCESLPDEGEPAPPLQPVVATPTGNEPMPHEAVPDVVETPVDVPVEASMDAGAVRDVLDVPSVDAVERGMDGSLVVDDGDDADVPMVEVIVPL